MCKVEILRPTDAKKMLFIHRKDQYHNKQILAIHKQPDFTDHMIWRMSMMFGHSLVTPEAAKVRSVGELAVARENFIDSTYDTLTSSYAREQCSSIDWMGLPWLGGTCQEVRVSGSSSVFGTSEQDLKKLTSEKLAGDFEGYKKSVKLETAKYLRSREEAQELLGKQKDALDSEKKDQEFSLKKASADFKKKLQVMGFKGEVLYNCLWKPTVPKFKVVLYSKYVDVDSQSVRLGQTGTDYYIIILL
jgi:hypothetical protein